MSYPPPQPPPGAEPYPGFSQTHSGHQHPQQPSPGAPQQSAGLGDMVGMFARNQGLPPPSPGISAEQRAAYDNAQKVVRAKFRRVFILLAIVAVGIIIAIIQAIL